jgi:6-pyruvoyltetrahydropterin/6-carboxytetrahydropterin synthase
MSLYFISVTANFAASHQIPGYKGLCARLHGHNWKVEVTWSADRLNELGMGIDFHAAESLMSPILGELDHTHLNDHPFFKDRLATSENVAYLFFTRLKDAIKADGETFPNVRVDQVAVTEMEPYRSIYRESPAS